MNTARHSFKRQTCNKRYKTSLKLKKKINGSWTNGSMVQSTHCSQGTWVWSPALMLRKSHPDTCKSSSRVSNTLIWLLRAPIHLVYAHRDTYTHANTEKSITIILIKNVLKINYFYLHDKTTNQHLYTQTHLGSIWQTSKHSAIWEPEGLHSVGTKIMLASEATEECHLSFPSLP